MIQAPKVVDLIRNFFLFHLKLAIKLFFPGKQKERPYTLHDLAPPKLTFAKQGMSSYSGSA